MGMCSSRFWANGGAMGSSRPTMGANRAARWGQRALPWVAVGVMLAQGALWADGVTRTLEPVSGGCKVTLAWEFDGTVESDLIIEERLAKGWFVDDTTVPFGSLDASWFSGNVARFAVKPALLAKVGSISFTVVAGEGAESGAVVGDWKMYLAGSLKKGAVAGASNLLALSVNAGTGGMLGVAGTTGAAGNTAVVEKAVAITSFKMIGGGVVELSYSGWARAGRRSSAMRLNPVTGMCGWNRWRPASSASSGSSF